MSVVVLALLALMCLEGVRGKPMMSLVGPYISYVERLYSCEPDNRILPVRWYLRNTHFNPYKPKELQRLTGNLTAVNVTFDNSCWVKVILDSRSVNTWKENAVVINLKNNGCRHLKEYVPGFYDPFFKKREINGVCKVTPGVYEVNNTPIDWTLPKFPIAPYGYVRFRFTFGRAENLYACLAADFRTVQKPD